MFKKILAISLLITSISSSQATEGNFSITKFRAERDIKKVLTLTQRQQAIVKISALSALELTEALQQVVATSLEKKYIGQQDVVLILTQLTSYYGFPRAEKSIDALASSIDKHLSLTLPPDTSKARYKKGVEEYTKLDNNGYQTIITAFKPMSVGLTDTTYQLFGDAFGIPGLTIKERQLATISALAALGTARPQLQYHLGTSIQVGLTKAEIMDMVIYMQFLAGMPAAYNAALAAKEVFAAKSENPYTD
ncbi:carboxymuconolactone decarboxylase family protein [Pseudoalteromonas sp. DL2-H2.2]|uniref:carboxymuconolactone decarboxylase family protein n=1 Tax=Pseudoalteromonas sp. DL2-H2.2 TaxID=2908889 RepID=UPI001F1C1133|nr:carboxymuconolactone decarboxylase family protein [Pseudoalteromonas sp. DL2-H2.2]MCF2908175.1 carboxymuconolactone decarboxylase family protein [Pseudoalteromonas sp. DL2-H2.2]